MHLAEPRLYWRVKTHNGWRYVPAEVERDPYGRISGVRYPKVIESGDESD